MSKNIPSVKDLYKVGAHFGHQRSKTDARAHDFVYTFQNKVAVINLDKTVLQIEKALDFIASKASEGSKLIIVGTKIQSKDRVKDIAQKCNQSYVNERWPGGLLTNYKIVSKSIKSMIKTEEDLETGKFDHLTKNERLKIKQSLEKTKKIFGGLKNLDSLPGLLFVIDAKEESNAITEAKTKGIPVVALCDTDSNPREIDFPIVINDESTQTLDLILKLVCETVMKNYKEPQKEDVKIEERVEKALHTKIKKDDEKDIKNKTSKDDGKN